MSTLKDLSDQETGKLDQTYDQRHSTEVYIQFIKRNRCNIDGLEPVPFSFSTKTKLGYKFAGVLNQSRSDEKVPLNREKHGTRPGLWVGWKGETEREKAATDNNGSSFRYIRQQRNGDLRDKTPGKTYQAWHLKKDKLKVVPLKWPCHRCLEVWMETWIYNLVKHRIVPLQQLRLMGKV